MFNKKNCSVYGCRKRDVTWFWIDAAGLRVQIVACADHTAALIVGGLKPCGQAS